MAYLRGNILDSLGYNRACVINIERVPRGFRLMSPASPHARTISAEELIELGTELVAAGTDALRELR